jgi:heat shock protein HslJ
MRIGGTHARAAGAGERSPSLQPAQLKRVTLAVLLTLLAAGCASTGDTQTPALAETRWQMIEASFALAAPPAPRPTLELRTGRLSAASGCNLAMGSFRETAGRLEVGQLASTRRACAPDVDRVEQAYFALLGDNPAIQVQGNILTLTGSRARARFARLPPAGGEAISQSGADQSAQAAPGR